MLDCGGGTVDGVAYTVTSDYPLRLESEIGPPTGMFAPSSLDLAIFHVNLHVGIRS